MLDRTFIHLFIYLEMHLFFIYLAMYLFIINYNNTELTIKKLHDRYQSQ